MLRFRQISCWGFVTIAQKLSRHEHIVRSWIKSYAKNGIDGLNSKKPSGSPKIKGCIVEEEVEIMLTKTPRDFGYQEAGWTVRLLLDFFSKETPRERGHYS